MKLNRNFKAAESAEKNRKDSEAIHEELPAL